jgi:hypothetical protein
LIWVECVVGGAEGKIFILEWKSRSSEVVHLHPPSPASEPQPGGVDSAVSPFDGKDELAIQLLVNTRRQS